MVDENLFTLFTLGFSACFILYCLFKLFFEKKNRLYIHIALFSIAFFINRALKVTLIRAMLTPYQWGVISSISIKMVMLFFYAFLLSFLRPPKKSIVGIALKIGMGYVVFGMIAKLLEDTSFTFLFDFYNNGFIYVDLTVLLIVFIYLLDKKEKHIRLIFYGIIYVMVCAFAIYFGRKIINFDAIGFTKNILRQIEIVGGFCFFFLAILKKESENEKERLALKSKILTNQLEKQILIQEERARISHDMHDELGAGISSLKLQVEYIKQKMANNHSVSADIEEILKTSEDMNTSMREMMWSLDTENDSIDSFIMYVTDYATPFLLKAQIKLKIEHNLQHNNALLSLKNKRQLLLCIKEALNNSYKHSKATLVTLSFSESETHFTTSIIDNGNGIAPNYIAGNGLKNMGFRMKASNGTFAIIPSEIGLHLQFVLPLV